MKMLYWCREQAGRWLLLDEKRSEIGLLHRVKGARYRAWFYMSATEKPLWVERGTVDAARNALQAELDKRSIGLFGEDHILFQKDQLS